MASENDKEQLHGSTTSLVEQAKAKDEKRQDQTVKAENVDAHLDIDNTSTLEKVSESLKLTPSISSLRSAKTSLAAATSIVEASITNGGSNMDAIDSPALFSTSSSLKSGNTTSKTVGEENVKNLLGSATKLGAAATAQAETYEPGRLSELKRFTLWETKTKFYLVAYNTSQTRFRILKIDRTPERVVQKTEGDGISETAPTINDEAPSKATNADAASGNASSKANPLQNDQAHLEAAAWNLNVTSDRVVYTRSQVTDLLDMIGEGNKSTGGIKEVGRFFGIIGFIRFTSTYYMVLISRRSVVGLLGGHYIYHCDETRILPVCHASVLASVSGRTKVQDQEEARLLHTFKQVDLSKNFYFSYTYDLTNTLQDNLTSDGSKYTKNTTAWGYNEKFVWNHHLLVPAFASSQHSSKLADSDAASEWVLPLVYGFVDQAKLCVLNCTIHVTLIARRSRHFAGARFLKRGTDENGHVANDVETEQIVSEALTTPFYAPRARKRGESGTTVGPNPRYTSYVMHRGSIPIYWTQDSTNMSPRPPIEISVVDPYYSSAALHFDDMLRRYGHPIIVLNLIKSKEKQPREVKLLGAFGECVGYLNQFLPKDKKLRYIAWDMSRASKSRDQDVIGVLEDIAEETVNATKFFHSGPEPNSFAFSNGRKERRETILLQSGVARVNCVDCLDRTNAAQFVIGKAAFGHQLHALGLLDDPSLPFDSAAVDMLTEMYHDLGDTIALQYGGSHLVNTMETYRKINQWTSHSRDMLEGLKRYYANSFVDADKQAAINLFLGVDNDVVDSRPLDVIRQRRHYQNWFTPEYLEPRDPVMRSQTRLEEIVNGSSSFWAEYYRPSLFTDLLRHHAFKMTAVHQHMSQFPVPTNSSNLPASPSMSISSFSRLTSQGSGITIPASPLSTTNVYGKAYSTLSNESTLTTTSPFTSRITGVTQQVGGNQSRIGKIRGDETSSSRVTQPAIIGGVRRWMSLNRGDNTGHQRHTSISSPNSKGKSHEVEEEKKAASKAQTLSGESAWPTWEEITGAQVTAPATETLLNSLNSPSVSAEEAKEYAWWLYQFRDVAFDGGLPQSIPEPAALMPIAAGGIGVGLSSLAPLYQIGIRRPATQKQRQQIAEADAQLYDYEVGISLGQDSALEKMEQGGTSDEEGKLDAALLNYPLSANTLNSIPSENKVRAFSQWITGPNRTNPLISIKV